MKFETWLIHGIYWVRFNSIFCSESFILHAIMGWLRLVGSFKVEVSFAEYMQNIVSFLGLFCKETYSYKEPTNRSHTIPGVPCVINEPFHCICSESSCVLWSSIRFPGALCIAMESFHWIHINSDFFFFCCESSCVQFLIFGPPSNFHGPYVLSLHLLIEFVSIPFFILSSSSFMQLQAASFFLVESFHCICCESFCVEFFSLVLHSISIQFRGAPCIVVEFRGAPCIVVESSYWICVHSLFHFESFILYAITRSIMFNRWTFLLHLMWFFLRSISFFGPPFDFQGPYVLSWNLFIEFISIPIFFSVLSSFIQSPGALCLIVGSLQMFLLWFFFCSFYFFWFFIQSPGAPCFIEGSSHRLCCDYFFVPFFYGPFIQLSEAQCTS